MNTYQKGVSDAVGTECIIGTPGQIFYPENYKERVDSEWIQRKLSTQDVATLCHVDPSTVCRWRKKGWLKGKKSGHRKEWRKWTFWRYSLKDVEDCLLTMKTRKARDNPVEHKTWTPQEEEMLLQGIRPEGRSKVACRIKKCRLKQSIHVDSHSSQGW